MFNKLMIAICVFALSASAQAQTAAPKKKVKKTVTTTTTVEEVNEDGSLYTGEPKVESQEIAVTDTSGLPTPNESWYTLWGLGVSGGSYSGDVGDIFESQSSDAGADKSTALNMDLLGFYWPLAGHKTMIGFIINGTVDSFTYANGNKSTLATRLWAFSTQHFFGKNIGDGWFVRGDVGLATASAIYTIGATEFSYGTDPELGFMFGGGYGMPLGQETRLLVGLYIRPIPEQKFDSGETIKGTVTSLTAGFLF